MMWEWRIFYNENETPSWISPINKLLSNVPVEKRTDLYIDLHSVEFGLKIRAFSETHQLLELKVLRKVKGEYEYWEKLMKKNIQLNENSLDLGNIVVLLEQTISKTSTILRISELIKTQQTRELKICKYRRKLSIDSLSIESVSLLVNQKEMFGVQLEGYSISTIKSFMKKHEIPTNQYKNTSYARFLMEL